MIDRQISTIGRKRRASQGFSLIEVLVAITLLVVGIVAVIEIFPPGFLSINRTSAASRADTMASRIADQLRQLDSFRQTSLIATQYTPNSDPLIDYPRLEPQNPVFPPWQVRPGETGPPYDHYWVSTPTADYGDDNINSERQVIGETTRLPQANSLSTCLYTVNFGPIYCQAGSEANTLTVTSLPWAPISASSANSEPPGGVDPSFDYISSNDPNNFLTSGQPQFGIDYVNGEMAFPSENGSLYDEPFTLTYSEVNASGTVKQIGPTSYLGTEPALYTSPEVYGTALANTQAIPSATNNEAISRWFPVPGLDSGYTVVPNSVVLTRAFAFVTSFGPDPFQFTLLNRLSTDVASGMISFNPASASMKAGDGQTAGVSISYLVMDWHILHEDFSNNEGVIRVALAPIINMGDFMDANTNYNGLLTRLSVVQDANAVMVVDMDTGQPLINGGDYSVDFAAGRINLTSQTQFVNDRLRVFYRARNEYGIAVSKAAARYLPGSPVVYSSVSPPADSQASLGHYWVDPNYPTRIYFPLTDAGKTVHVAGIAVINGGIKGYVADAGSFLIQAPDVNTPAKMSYIDLAISTVEPTAGFPSNDTAPLSSGQTIDTSNPNPIRSIIGASANVRIVWSEGGIVHFHDFNTFLESGHIQ